MADRPEMSERQRARMKKERKQMVREAKQYRRQRQSKAEARAAAAKKSPTLPKDVYNDSFFTDETKARREKAKRAKEKRQKNKRQPITPEKRRFRRVFTYCLIFTVILAIGAVLSLTVLFKTEKIQVEGNTLYDEDKIIALSGVKMEENIFLSKFSSTPGDIVDALPYIEDARVDFKIPDTICITVKNADAAYVIISGGLFYKISASGRILEQSDQGIENLPIILCPELKDTQVGKYVEFSDAGINDLIKEIDNCITENGFENINYIDVNDMSSISMVYDGRIKIIIGLPEDISYKLKTAMTIIGQKLDINGAEVTGTLDVSQCSETKKSYFRDGDISLAVTLPSQETQPPETQPATTQPVTESADSADYDWTPSDEGGYTGDYSGDNTGDYSGDYTGDYSGDYTGDYSGDNSADNSADGTGDEDLSQWGWYDEEGNYYDGNGNLYTGE